MRERNCVADSSHTSTQRCLDAFTPAKLVIESSAHTISHKGLSSRWRLAVEYSEDEVKIDILEKGV